MRDHHRGAAFGDAVEFGLDRLLGLRIQRRGGFVEDQDRGVLQQRARDGDALFLAAGEFQAALAHFGGVAVGEGRECARGCAPRARRSRRPRGVASGGRTGCCSRCVSLNSTVSCGTIAMARAQRGLRDVAQVAAVGCGSKSRRRRRRRSDRAGARAWICPSPNARPRRRCRPPALEIDALQDLATRVVAEAHLLEAHGRALRTSGRRRRAVLHVLRLFEQAEEAFDIGERLLHLAVHHAEEVERRRQLQQVGVHQHQVADRSSPHHAAGGAPHQRRDAECDDRVLADVEHRRGSSRRSRWLLPCLRRLAS
jgi:hypothetical protein